MSEQAVEHGDLGQERPSIGSATIGRIAETKRLKVEGLEEVEGIENVAPNDVGIVAFHVARDLMRVTTPDLSLSELTQRVKDQTLDGLVADAFKALADNNVGVTAKMIKPIVGFARALYSKDNYSKVFDNVKTPPLATGKFNHTVEELQYWLDNDGVLRFRYGETGNVDESHEEHDGEEPIWDESSSGPRRMTAREFLERGGERPDPMEKFPTGLEEAEAKGIDIGGKS